MRTIVMRSAVGEGLGPLQDLVDLLLQALEVRLELRLESTLFLGSRLPEGLFVMLLLDSGRRIPGCGAVGIGVAPADAAVALELRALCVSGGGFLGEVVLVLDLGEELEGGGEGPAHLK
jgi:hypothetical protein